MSEWKTIKLNTITEFLNRGISPKYSDSGNLIVNQKCIRENRLSYKEARYSDIDKRIADDRKLKIGDILVNSTGTGTLGRTAQVKEIHCVTSVDTHVTIVRINSNFDSRFIAYQLAMKEPEIVALGKGATNQQELGREELGNLEINLPPLPTQRRIASILSAYDDLIENNLKRIKLLEELAQRTYEEWFVKFRINGEQLPIDEKTGLPVGWEKVNLNTVYSIKYGKNLPQTEISEKGEYPVYGASGVMGYYNFFNYNEKVVLVTSRGNGSGDIHRTYETSFVTNNSFAVTPKITYEYLHLPFNLNFFKTLNLKSYCSGSAQPQLTNASMDNIMINLPKSDYVIRYNHICDKLIDQADNLRKSNQKLKESRDILLPRLMSGKINVE
jgi:type I restriction enzyme S subunit